MSALAYRSSSDNGLSFDLLVDGVALGEVLGDGNEGIPYWIVEDDLPHWPPHGTPRDPEYRIVTVCSCGEYGCGHTRCRVIKTADTVALRDFAGDVGADGAARVFTFSRSGYEQVVSEIVAEARHQKETNGEQSAPPNGGPATPVENSRLTEGPPSVS
ncbi:MAG TPA: hypothetical protein P5186_15765 [Candidatus Paceibacterota bacterium]|nr:hypothetical protein [Candidatus Paceibacterota bacterium]